MHHLPTCTSRWLLLSAWLGVSLIGLPCSAAAHARGAKTSRSASTAGRGTGISRIQAIRFWSFGDVTRVAIETTGDYKLFSDQIDKPARVYFDLTGLQPPRTATRGIQRVSIHDRLVREIRVAAMAPGKTRVVFDLEAPADVVSSQLVNPDRLMVEIRPRPDSKPTVSLARNRGLSQSTDASNTAAPKRASTPPPARTPVQVFENKAAAGAPDVKQAEPSGEQIETNAPVSTSVASNPSSTPANVLGSTAKNQFSQIPLAVTNSPAAAVRTGAESSAEPPPVGSHEASPPSSTRSTRANSEVAPAKLDSSGDRSLVRILGLKLGRVIIDAGHGGHDTGTIGPGGLMEKDLVLDVALRLGKLITQQLGAEVVYTRSADVFIPLEQRTKIANNERADLFISIHANSSPEPNATGVETYYFNLTSDRAGLDVAMRENAASLSSIADLNDLLHKAVLENKLEESREFAQKIQTSLSAASLRINTRSRDRGVRQAPFVVLIGASMPSILTEIGFVSNPHDERLLRRPEQRQKIAEALLKGITQYAGSLSHVQLARARK